MSDTDSLSDQDEEFYDFLNSNFFNRRYRRRIDHLSEMREDDFRRRFRLSKDTTIKLLEKIEHRLTNNQRNYPISPMNQLLCTLRFYATGSQLVTCGDFVGIHESSACRIIHRVTDAIASLNSQFIKMPSTLEEQRTTAVEFYNIARFPRCIGAIDCTHVKINSPGGEDAELYRNRKGIFSINVQAICNARLIFTDVVARWFGSAHDSNIWDNCNQKRNFLHGTYPNKVLVGDAGYAQTSYMMVPLNNVSNRGESLYNESQIRTRNVIERLFGIWKRRFPILSRGIQVKKCRIPGIIISTAVIHNLCRMEGDEEPPLDPDYPPDLEENDNSAYVNNLPASSSRPQRARQELIENHFSRLERQEQ